MSGSREAEAPVVVTPVVVLLERYVPAERHEGEIANLCAVAQRAHRK